MHGEEVCRAERGKAGRPGKSGSNSGSQQRREWTGR